MSLQKLQKKALRELKASPQKAAVLALLAAVAAWFWAPLVFKSQKAAIPVAAAPAPVTSPAPIAAPTAQSATAAGANKPTMSWREAATAIDHDPKMSSAKLEELAQQRNPFAPPVGAVSPEQVAAEKDNDKKPEVEVDQPPAGPDELGLVLSSTLVGRSKRAALISGRTYELGSKIRVEGEAFRLVEVEPNRIVLERDGQQYTLSIKRRESSGRLELRPATP